MISLQVLTYISCHTIPVVTYTHIFSFSNSNFFLPSSRYACCALESCFAMLKTGFESLQEMQLYSNFFIFFLICASSTWWNQVYHYYFLLAFFIGLYSKGCVVFVTVVWLTLFWCGILFSFTLLFTLLDLITGTSVIVS